MSKQVYDWKRFWCPRSGSINLEDGYLPEPSSDWGRACNPNLASFSEIANLPCLVLLGEAGMGKTRVIENAHQQVYEQAKDSKDVCLPLLKLGDYESDADLCNAIFRNAAFQSWLLGTHKLHLFLDSLDEGLLSIKILVRILKREIENLPCDRFCFRITCRTAEWAPSLEEKLKEKWGEDNVGVYTLAPLRRDDVIEAATQNNIINADDFLQTISDRNAVPLAIKPITLQFLIDIYSQKGQLPASQVELYEQGCLLLCKEVNPDRCEAGWEGKLSSRQRRIVASRIAAVMLFSQRSAVWISSEYGRKRDSDISIQDLCTGREKTGEQSFDVDESCIKDVFAVTELFSGHEVSHQIGFAHRTYAEFLAAWYLVQHEIPLTQIIGLIYSSEDLDHKLVPQLHETAAWLASMRMDVFQKIIKTDPDILLRSDIPADASVRSSIVDNLLTQYEEEKLFDRDRNNYRNYAKLVHPELPDQLRFYICNSSKQIDARDLAIDIAEVCEISELQEELVNLALDSSQSVYLRVSAVKALCSIGNSGTRLKLKPLAIEQLPEDEDDRLKGYALQALWSDHLTAEELFQTLTPSKKSNFFGSYQMFLDYKLVPKLKPDDLVVALNWLEEQGVRYFEHPFERLGDALLLRAWEDFDLPGLLESFTKVALVQWREYQRIITCDSELQQQFTSALKDTKKRLALIERAVLSILRTGEDLDLLFSSQNENIVFSEDIFWMLEKLKNSHSKEVQRIWVQLIQWSFNRQSAKEIDAIITATQMHDILHQAFAPYFAPIELDSIQAENLRADYLRVQEIKARKQNSLLDPPPKERVLQLLEKLESGDLSAWWQLNREMTLKSDSQHYADEFEWDLTALPGWKEAEDSTRQRIIRGAKKYILEQDQIPHDWIGTDKFDRSALGGCKAFYLLLKESPDFLSTLSTKVWIEWMPVMIAAPHNEQSEDYLHLIQLGYGHAPSETIATLMSLIDKKNQEGGCVLITHFRKFIKCWDKRLESSLLEKAKDQSLKPKYMKQLLEELLKHESNDAREFAKSLICFPLPETQNEREKVFLSCKVLIKNADPFSWPMIWSAIQQDTNFGRELIESVASHYSRGAYINLAEQQLADLYIWLVYQYPHDEDPDYSNSRVTIRKSVEDLRDYALRQLENCGTSQSCVEIQRIIQEFPKLTWLSKVLINARINLRRRTWKPPKPEEILQIILDQDKRFVQDGHQLLKVLIESLKRLELELQGETSACRDLWDKVRDNLFRPIDENAFSDYVKRFLDRDLKSRGIIVNREVELRRSYGGKPGERTDIHVDAVLKRPNGETYDSITVIIEVKGCWHPEVETAMKSQLVGRYLADNTCKYGLYLIGWFSCQQWDSQDSRKNKTPKMTTDEARKQFDDQAETLSSSGNVVRAYVLNAALR